MILNGNAASDSMITVNTTSNDIGLCYYDPIQETILELSQLPDSMLFVKPRQSATLNFYLVSKLGSSITNVKVSVSSDQETNEVKILSKPVKPSSDEFDAVQVNNYVTITSPQEEHLNPLWLQIKSLSGKVSIKDLTIDIEYS